MICRATYKRLMILTLILAINFTVTQVRSQTQEEVHQFFERQATLMNAQRSKHSTQEIELMKVVYERKPSALTYTYKVDLSKTANKMASKDEITALRAVLVQGTCNGDLAPFVRQHNLRIKHTYVSKGASSMVQTFEISKGDCLLSY